MGMCKAAAAGAALVMMAAGSLLSAAQAATLKFETYYLILGNAPDGEMLMGKPLIVEVDYDDTGILGASYSIDGYEGAFDNVAFSSFWYNGTRPGAYGRDLTYGVRLRFDISDDALPFDVGIEQLAFMFATEPGKAYPGGPDYTEAELLAFFGGATSAMAQDYRYVDRFGTRRTYKGAFGGFSFLETDGGPGTGETDPVLETPLPAAGLLMLGGLGAMGGALRRRKPNQTA